MAPQAAGGGAAEPSRASLHVVIRAVVVHQDAGLRDEIAGVLADEDVRVVACLDTPEAYADCAPDVVVLAHRPPGTSAVDLCERLRAADPSCPAIVVVAADPRAVLLRRAIQTGATGFVCAGSPPQVLREAIRWASAGRVFLDPACGGLVVELVAKTQKGLPYGLTRAELDVVALLPKGMPNREIANELGISENTVKTHLRHALRKLGVRDRAQAAALVVREGLA
ncbi:MAG TPA: response regulator transcription factor [Frankiaceae bacterium]|nr:response regulator transcription factor [Frankiaceae bacterium]